MAKVLIYSSCFHFSGIPVEGTCNQRRLWSDCAYAQSDLSLRWSHKSKCRFCLALVQIGFVSAALLRFINSENNLKHSSILEFRYSILEFRSGIFKCCLVNTAIYKSLYLLQNREYQNPSWVSCRIEKSHPRGRKPQSLVEIPTPRVRFPYLEWTGLWWILFLPSFSGLFLGPAD